MRDVLILREPDQSAESWAKRLRLQLVIDDGYNVEFDRAIFVEPGITIPWDLLRSGLRILERWDVAAPLWRYGVLAADVGTPEERERTEKVTLDLRVLLYAHELLLVRNSDGGRLFLSYWQDELAGGGDKRLAFLRAVYRAKPVFCALPRTWVAEVQQRSARDARLVHQSAGPELVSVQVKPGLYIKCRPGEEQETLERYRNRRMRREKRTEVVRR